MFLWTSGFHNPLAHTDFNMFVDEWTSDNVSPEDSVNCIVCGRINLSDKFVNLRGSTFYRMFFKARSHAAFFV